MNHTTLTKFCFACGESIDARAEICPRCGVRQHAPPVLRKEKSRVMAIVLALCLGGVGAHKFYVGRIGLGVLYLVFFWTFIPAIVAFIEGLIYLTWTDEEFAEKYS